MLEIGTGWGTLAIEAARRGAHVTTLTLSRRAGRAWPGTGSTPPGSADAVDVRLQDYREVDGSYDAIVSVEMIEAVGEEFWPTYFSVLDQRLAPGGVVAIQSILMSHDRYLRHPQLLRLDPEAHLPRRPHPVAAGDRGDDRPAHRAAGQPRCTRSARTTPRRCDAGVTRSTSSGPRSPVTGFDETFRRTWEFYLAYSEAGFASGYLDVAHLRLTRSGEVVS